MPRQIGHNSQCHPDNGRRTRCKAIEPIGKVRSVRYCRYDKNRYQYENNPAGGLCMFSQKRNKVGIIEVIIFHKRDRRLCRLDILGKILYLGGIVFLDGNIFTNHGLGAQIERQPDDKSQTDLSENFESAVKPLLVMMFELHVVVEETDSPHPNSRNEHQNHINIIETAHQQTGNKNGNYDDNSPHRGSSLFAHLPFEPEIPYNFADLHTLQPGYDAPTYNRRNKQR